MQMRKEHKIVDSEIMIVFTIELTESDLENKNDDESSSDDAHVLTNKILDRIAIKDVRDKSFVGKNNQLCIK